VLHPCRTPRIRRDSKQSRARPTHRCKERPGAVIGGGMALSAPRRRMATVKEGIRPKTRHAPGLRLRGLSWADAAQTDGQASMARLPEASRCHLHRRIAGHQVDMKRPWPTRVPKPSFQWRRRAAAMARRWNGGTMRRTGSQTVCCAPSALRGMKREE
jgi:hypothetical protein